MRYIFLVFIFLINDNSTYSQNQLITNDFVYRLKLRVKNAYVSYNTDEFNGGCNPWHNDQGSPQKIELKWDIEAQETPDLNNEIWSDNGSCMGQDDYSFSDYYGTGLYHEFYDETFSNNNNENIGVYVAFDHWESDGCGATCEYNTGCQSLTCPLCPSDNCHLGWCTSGSVSLPIENCNYNREWHDLTTVICDASDYGKWNAYAYLDIEFYYETMDWRGDQQSDAFGFGTIDQNGCPDVYHCFNNTDRFNTGPRTAQYYEITLTKKRKLKIDCSEQPNTPQGDLIEYIGVQNPQVGPIATYVLTPTYSNIVSVELDPGTYYILLKNNTAKSGKYKLKITSDDSTPFIWYGNINNDWHEVNNWSSCTLPTLSTPVNIPLTSNQPIIYNGATGQCQTIQVETNAKLTIENTGKLNTQ